jgi:hypothetical protein
MGGTAVLAVGGLGQKEVTGGQRCPMSEIEPALIEAAQFGSVRAAPLRVRCGCNPYKGASLQSC